MNRPSRWTSFPELALPKLAAIASDFVTALCWRYDHNHSETVAAPCDRQCQRKLEMGNPSTRRDDLGCAASETSEHPDRLAGALRNIVPSSRGRKPVAYLTARRQSDFERNAELITL